MARFTELTELADLASVRVGGRALAANDEFFAPKENLLKPGPRHLHPRQVHRPRQVDGRLGDAAPPHAGPRLVRRAARHAGPHPRRGRGHQPLHRQLPGALLSRRVLPAGGGLAGDAPRRQDRVGPSPPGVEARRRLAEPVPGPKRPRVDPRAPQHPSRRRRRAAARLRRGGGGRGRPRPVRRSSSTWPRSRTAGSCSACSDMFFGPKDNLIMPGRAANMGDGWETKRRRGPGHDWLVLRLGAPAVCERIEIDTNHFKGNYPDSCSLEGCRPGSRASRRWRATPRAGRRSCRGPSSGRTGGTSSLASSWRAAPSPTCASASSPTAA